VRIVENRFYFNTPDSSTAPIALREPQPTRSVFFTPKTADSVPHLQLSIYW